MIVFRLYAIFILWQYGRRVYVLPVGTNSPRGDPQKNHLFPECFRSSCSLSLASFAHRSLATAIALDALAASPAARAFLLAFTAALSLAPVVVPFVVVGRGCARVVVAVVEGKGAVIPSPSSADDRMSSAISLVALRTIEAGREL